MPRKTMVPSRMMLWRANADASITESGIFHCVLPVAQQAAVVAAK
jgi:hypothetical protein